jgi:UDP-glucose 4-epimerase
MAANKHILVTGGAGFIGSHTVAELLQAGYDVTIADDLSNARVEVIEAIERITGKKPVFKRIDLCDRSAVMQLFGTNGFDAVIHFAAKKLVGESVADPMLYYRTNLLSLINLTDVAMATHSGKIVFSSSCTVYGQPDELPVTESSPVRQPESPYGNTKKISEEILRDTCSASDQLNVIALRYFNPVGAHDSALIGEYPLGPPSNLMPVITQVAIGKRPLLEVFGTDYNTPDGSCIRDYIHVVDLALAHVVAVRRILEGKTAERFETFNLGTGKGLSVLEIIHAFERVDGVKLNYKISGRRPGDVEKIYGSTEKANNVLGWKSLRSVDEMVSSAWAWEKALAVNSGVNH